jgi:hypothetical protein
MRSDSIVFLKVSPLNLPPFFSATLASLPTASYAPNTLSQKREGIFDSHILTPTNHGHALSMSLVDATNLNRAAVAKGNFTPFVK